MSEEYKNLRYKMGESKPILVLRIPHGAVTPEGSPEEAKQKIYNYYRDLREQLTDYHVLALYDSSVQKLEFECINAINATEEDIENLKKRVEEIMGDKI
jgi:hypothetical protein